MSGASLFAEITHRYLEDRNHCPVLKANVYGFPELVRTSLVSVALSLQKRPQRYFPSGSTFMQVKLSA